MVLHVLVSSGFVTPTDLPLVGDFLSLSSCGMSWARNMHVCIYIYLCFRIMHSLATFLLVDVVHVSICFKPLLILVFSYVQFNFKCIFWSVDTVFSSSGHFILLIWRKGGGGEREHHHACKNCAFR